MSFLLDEEKTWIQRDFGLDRRLIKALSKQGFVYPTLVQAQCIPIAMQGKDMLVRARTGSGKTVAFSLPVLQKVLSLLGNADSSAAVKCVILAPTKELVKQIEKHITELMYYCRDNVFLCCLGDDSVSSHQHQLRASPDIVISTPTRLVQYIKSGIVDLSHVAMLVIDEADLVLSFGQTENVRVITASMPKIIQGILVSATLSAELDKFKKVVLHNPAIIKLEEPKGMGNLLQFYLEAAEDDKFLIVYVFIKLGLLQVGL
jgi:ATP-dependent RNA helicase DDX56/DBP9